MLFAFKVRSGLLLVLVLLASLAQAAEAPRPSPAASAPDPNGLPSSVSNSTDLVRRGNDAFRAGNRSNAIALFTQALELNPTNLTAIFNRARIHNVEGRYTNALADFNRLLESRPDHTGARQLRGEIHLRLGNLTNALADFDTYIQQAPKAEANHWQRGIAYYLLGRYEEGRRQFAMCHGRNTNDVEHALWHFLCLAKSNGVEKARSMLLKVGTDRRVVLNQIYELYQGKRKPEELLQALETITGDWQTPEQRQFFAHYYLGLYYDAQREVARSLEHLAQAAAAKPPDTLLPDLARVQIRLLHGQRSTLNVRRSTP